MDFKTATDRLTALCPTLDDVAGAVDRDPSSVRKARIGPKSKKSGRRAPPPGWEAGVAKLARARGEALIVLAEELEASRDS